MKYLNVGDKVLVAIPKAEKAAQSVLKYNDKKMTVSRRVPCGKLRIPYYELVGAKSDCGIPYAFVKEWLIEL